MKRVPLSCARFVLFLVLVASWPAAARGEYIVMHRVAPEVIGAFAELVDIEMSAPDGRFVYVTAGERERVNAALAEMARLLDGKASIAALTEDERVALFNAQSRANAVLRLRDRERLVCSRRSIVGTHRRETTCETYGELMARRQVGHDNLRLLAQPKTCLTATGAPLDEVSFCPRKSAPARGN